MNFRDLEYIVAVADLKSFAKAADKCFVSQPTLSMQVSKLEKELSVQIFERHKKGILLSTVGEKIVSKAKVILQEAQELSTIAKLSNNPFKGELSLGVFPTLAPYLLPLIIPELSKEFEELKFLLSEEKTAVLLEQLQSGKLDCIIIANKLNNKHFFSVELFEEKFYLAVSSKHKLASKKVIESKDFSDEKLLLLNEGHCLAEQSMDFCHLQKLSTREDFRATSLETLRQMVASNGGITFFPKLAVNPSDPNIKYLPFKKSSPRRKVYLYWRKSSPKQTLTKLLSERIRQTISLKSIL